MKKYLHLFFGKDNNEINTVFYIDMVQKSKYEIYNYWSNRQEELYVVGGGIRQLPEQVWHQVLCVTSIEVIVGGLVVSISFPLLVVIQETTETLHLLYIMKCYRIPASTHILQYYSRNSRNIFDENWR